MALALLPGLLVGFAAMLIYVNWWGQYQQTAELRERIMGIRPNQQFRQSAALPRCRHTSPPVPVEVHDTLDGRPEVVRWLCPDCYDETHPPPPCGVDGRSVAFGGPGYLSHPGEAANNTPLLLTSVTTAEIVRGIQRLQQQSKDRYGW